MLIIKFPSELKKNLKEKFLYAISVKPVAQMSHTELFDVSGVDYTNDLFKNVADDLESIISDNQHKFTSKNLVVSKDEIYVGNLNRDLQYEELAEFLGRFGELEALNMISDKKTNRFLGHAFVKFKDRRVHDMVIKQSNEYSLKGRKVIISQKLEKKVTLEDIESRCWFCLNNPNIEAELILKEFTEFYLAYPKGPIDNFHFLIIPKRHIKSFVDLTGNQKKEYSDILQVVTKLIVDNNLDYVVYEKNLPYKDEAFKHLIMNVIGIEKELSFNFLDTAYEILNKKEVKYSEFDPNLSIEKVAPKGSYYYYMDVPTGIQFGKSGVRSKILIEEKASKREFFDYPRIIVCRLLDEDEKVNWKNGEINKEFFCDIKRKLLKYFK